MEPDAGSPEGTTAPEVRSVVDPDALRGVCRQVIERAVREANSQVAHLEERLRMAEEALRLAVNSLQSKLHEKATLQAQAEAQPDSFVAMHRHLEGLVTGGKFLSFSFSGDEIIGLSPMIIIEHSRVKYEIGQFKVKVNVRTAIVRFELTGTNRQNRRALGTVTHPHVYDENACWGNVQAEVPKIIRRGDFGVIFELASDLLMSYNGVSPYQRITEFPRLTPPPPTPRPVRTPTPSTPEPSNGAGETPRAGGFFTRLAQSNPSALSGATPTQPTSEENEVSITVDGRGRPVEASAPVVFTDRVDHLLRERGINPTSLSAYERSKVRRLVSLNTGSYEFNRLLNYYIRWLRRSSRSRR